MGAGNVAGHLAAALSAAGARIEQVCSRTEDHACRLAAEVGAQAICSPADIDATVDFCIICATDSAIADIARQLPGMSGIVVHTSGTVPMDVLLAASPRVGVLYPLQTFSQGRPLNVREIPFFTEGSDASVLAAIDALAAMISGSVHHADSRTRPFLHVAGVLACNFPNYLIGCAAEVLARGGYSLDVVRPLVMETIAKAFEMGPDAAQTGPARRGNVDTIARHAAMLPEPQAGIYALLSEAILKKYHNEQD